MKDKHKRKEELSKLIDIPIRTLYNWEEKRPKLYKYLMECNSKESEIEKLFNELTEEEQELYLSEMKARILRRKLDKK